jgi:hypothetical protein
MTKRTRRNNTPAFKAKVDLTAIKGEKTLAELSRVEGRTCIFHTPNEIGAKRAHSQFKSA